jgi:hypothetical protein
MATVLDQAQNFSSGPVAAARQRDRWARKEANATDEETREQYREAIADLEARYPDIADVPVGGAEAFARERGHGTGVRSSVHDGRRRPRSGSEDSKRPAPQAPAPKGKQRKPTPGLDPTARRARSQGRSTKPRPTPRVDRAIRQTGIPAAASSTGGVIMQAMGVTVGLSLLYLLINEPRRGTDKYSGPEAVDKAVHSTVHFITRFVSTNEDIFPSPKGAPAGRPSSRPGAYNRRVQAGEVLGPPTPPRFLPGRMRGSPQSGQGR